MFFPNVGPGFGTFGPSMNMMFQMTFMMQMMQMMQGLMGRPGGCCPGQFPGMAQPGFGNMINSNYGMPSGGQVHRPLPNIPQSFGNIPYNGAGGAQGLANLAASMNGQHFKPGQTKRCADFVSTMLRQSGTAPPGFKHCVSCSQLQKYGTKVGIKDLKPGDVVFFGNTYRQGKYTHTGIYLGNGKFAHRPTANKPVRVDSLTSGRYAKKFTGGRRMPCACAPSNR